MPVLLDLSKEIIGRRALVTGCSRDIGAAVVNISSTAATMPFGPCAHYGAAKAALDFYSRTLAVELAPSVRVNVVTPGPVSTLGGDEVRKTFPGISGDEWLQWVPLKRIGTTDDIAEVVALLASDRGK
jgi:NAD(P)-dependent dehydrogenase (short-subunit alcohol dehydrogenase family)